MHIVIASVFDPIPSDQLSLGRYHHLSKALQANGHRVTYLTSRFLHATKAYRYDGNEEIEGIRYLKIPAPSYQSNIGWRRFYNHFVIARNVVKVVESVQEHEKIDLLLCASPPLLWCNALLQFCKKQGIKSVLDMQDLWPEAFKSVNPLIYKLTFNAFPLKLIHQQNIKLSSYITSVTQDYLQEIKNKNTKVFYLGAPASEIQKTILTNHPQKNNTLHLVFMGNMSSHKYLLQFLEVNKNENIEVTFIGKCGDKKIREHKLIRYLGELYNAELYSKLQENDYALFINDSYKEIKMPNKLFYYWACGLPVIGIDIKGEAKEIITTMQGVISNNYHLNIGDLKKSLAIIDRELIKQEALEKFDSKIIYRNFVSHLEEINKK